MNVAVGNGNKMSFWIDKSLLAPRPSLLGTSWGNWYDSGTRGSLQWNSLLLLDSMVEAPVWSAAFYWNRMLRNSPANISPGEVLYCK